MRNFSQYTRLINDALAALPYPQAPERLYAPIAYTMALGGKRLRPALTLMACEACGGDVDKALSPALGIEMFHNFTLLHDDVMDRADVRRGQPTVHRRWNDNVAILSGDTMLTLATRLVCRVDASLLPQALELFNRTAIEIYEGQQWDMDFERRDDVTVSDYLMMIRLKTSVLLGCACGMGALVAGADDAVKQGLYDMAVDMGLAFQLQDDWLDVWGDPATFGKQIGGDIVNNKKTYLLISALERADEDRREQLNRWLGDTTADRDRKVAAVTTLYEATGARDCAEQAIERHSRQAIERLQSIDIAPEGRAAFEQLINRLINRKS